MSEPTTLGALITTIGELKRVRRQGWLDRGVPPGATESVADHSFMTAILAWFAAAGVPTLDRDRVLKLALVHDLAESLTGDAPPYDPHELPDLSDDAARRMFFSVRHRRTAANSATKREAEAAAFLAISSGVPAALREEFTALWHDYEDGASPEARFVKECDTLEAALQAQRYATDDPDLPLSGFFDMARHEITHPVLTAIRDAVIVDGEPGT